MPSAESFFSRIGFGPVTLRVRDLARVASFYGDTLGFRTREVMPGVIAVCGHEDVSPLWILESSPSAPRPAAGAAGLFHVAVLFPSRASLGRMLLRMVEKRLRLGAADHAVSEALYIEDPEGNGIECYADRSSERWPLAKDGVQVAMVSDPIDYEGLAKEGLHSPGPLVPAGTRVGHVHLKVSSLEKAEKFYSGLLGGAVRQRDFPGALFLGFDGYHHHFGLNVWQSRRAAADGSQGLARVQLVTNNMAWYAEVALRARDLGVITEDKAGRLCLKDYDGLQVEILADEA